MTVILVRVCRACKTAVLSVGVVDLRLCSFCSRLRVSIPKSIPSGLVLTTTSAPVRRKLSRACAQSPHDGDRCGSGKFGRRSAMILLPVTYNSMDVGGGHVNGCWRSRDLYTRALTRFRCRYHTSRLAGLTLFSLEFVLFGHTYLFLLDGFLRKRRKHHPCIRCQM